MRILSNFLRVILVPVVHDMASPVLPSSIKKCCAGDTKKLWFNIEKPLKRCLSTVHLREVASQQVGIEQQGEIKAVLSVVDPDSEQCCGSVNISLGSSEIRYLLRNFQRRGAFIAAFPIEN
jgi:hypothetical protein